MDCTTQIEGTKHTLIFTGRFGFDAGQFFKTEVRNQLREDALTELHLDLSGITSMEPSALGLLLLLKEQADVKGVKLVLKRPSEAVRLHFNRVRFDTIFEIQP